jgi:hypothetical protein
MYYACVGIVLVPSVTSLGEPTYARAPSSIGTDGVKGARYED